MMRINKLTDYGIVVMTKIATMKSNKVHTAKEISHKTNIPLPTVTRLLKTLSNTGLLISQRGSQGGYALSISVTKPYLYSCSEYSFNISVSDSCFNLYHHNSLINLLIHFLV